MTENSNLLALTRNKVCLLGYTTSYMIFKKICWTCNKAFCSYEVKLSNRMTLDFPLSCKESGNPQLSTECLRHWVLPIQLTCRRQKWAKEALFTFKKFFLTWERRLKAGASLHACSLLQFHIHVAWTVASITTSHILLFSLQRFGLCQPLCNHLGIWTWSSVCRHNAEWGACIQQHQADRQRSNVQIRGTTEEKRQEEERKPTVLTSDRTEAWSWLFYSFTLFNIANWNRNSIYTQVCGNKKRTCVINWHLQNVQ